MSIKQPTNSTKPSSQSHGTPALLSEANVAAHNESSPTNEPNNLSVQRWLEYTGDRLVSGQAHGTASSDWVRPRARDAMAADFERMSLSKETTGAKKDD